MFKEFRGTWQPVLFAALLMATTLPVHGQLVGRPIEENPGWSPTEGIPQLLLKDWQPLPEHHPVVRSVETYEARRQVIGQVYERYELVARAAGSDLAFDLTDFKSILPREYPDVRWLDLFTRGDGEVVAPSGHETVNEVTGESRLHYEFAWRPGVEREVVTLDQERFGSYSISDALLILKLMDRGGAFPFRIETYLVTLYLDGESRTYRAAAFFYGVRDQLTVRFEDQVALRLQELALEERRVESKSRVSRWRQEWLEGARAGRITSEFGTQQCEARQFPKTSGSLATVDGTQDHESGKLLLWVDGDQDGTSSPSELTDLATAGVEWIDLDVVESRSRDRHGNEFRYKSRVRTRRGMSKSVDVFLLTGP